MKRNLMNELTEGIGALAEKRQQEKKRVYIVFVDGYNQNRNFCDVFFTEDAARQYISKRTRPRSYDIEIFEETDNGGSKEIY